MLSGSKNIRFSEVTECVKAFGFQLVRINGSHRIYNYPDVEELINLQDVKGQAKPYQVKQLLRISVLIKRRRLCMATLNIKSSSGETDTIKKLLTNGLEEERRRIKFALDLSDSTIRNYEEKYHMSSADFIQKFKNGEIEENDDTFNWWAEYKIRNELSQKIKMIEDIEICQQ